MGGFTFLFFFDIYKESFHVRLAIRTSENDHKEGFVGEECAVTKVKSSHCCGDC
jgi:hypothetical protein